MTGSWPNDEKFMTPSPTTTPASRVLVVEDEPNIRELVCLHLGHEGYLCDAVGDGQIALKHAEADRYDLMVIDLMIPGLDGLSLCRAVRNGQRNHDVPILILTAAGRVGQGDRPERRRRLPHETVRRSRARICARALLRRPRQPQDRTATQPAASSDAIVSIHGIEVDLRAGA